jgi:FAD/FMN-containing dehydrogenase
MHARVETPGHPILPRLEALLGREHVLTDPLEREFYSTDIYARGRMPLAVVRPGSAEEVSRLVKLALEHGLSVVPRGGGASYTDGYLPAEEHALLVDTSRLNRIVEINERDMYVLVEAGVTWATLNEALQARGLRTPFYGPFSGIAATVGGSLSQGSVSWGTGQWGVSGENVLGVEAVIGNGEVVRTGSWGAANSVPFFRSYGPDLTGLFMGDTGAFGIKTTIALRLQKRCRDVIGLSFGFQDFEHMAAGMEAAAKEGINLINFGLDPKLQEGQLGKADVATGLQAARSVFRNSRGFLDGVRQVGKIAFAGRSFLKGAVYSAHWLVEGIDAASARSAAGRLREVLQPHGAEVPATVPTVANAMPFMPLFNVRGPRGERWVPVHGILPFSRVMAFHRELQAYLSSQSGRMKQVNLYNGAMFMTVSTNAFLYEPAFYWHDATTITHERLVPAEYLQTLPKYAANPEGRAVMHEIKVGVTDLFQKHGAVHLQIGKFYPYMRGRHPATAQFVRDLKQVADPSGTLNPGSLGL